MNTPKSILVAGLTAFVAAPLAHAGSAGETGTANIVAPLNVTSGSELDFGDVAPDLSAAGTVEIQTDGTKVCGNGITCFDTTPATVATFSVSGFDGSVYNIVIPSTIDLEGTDTADGHSMTATLVASKSTGILTGGSDSFSVGGTLTVGADQAPGSYAASFLVSIQYQ